jgi:hypothetical protein
MDDPRVERVRHVAQAILARLGDQAERWSVLDVGWTPPWDAQLSVVAGPASGDGDVVTVYVLTHVPEAMAVAELASQLQDHVIEATWGAPLPPCPGHPHPLAAHVVDGVAVWECPNTPGHYREPIV